MASLFKQITEITIFLILVAVGVYWLFPTLEQTLLANIYINGIILFVLLIGIFLVYKTMYDLIAAQRWSDQFRELDAVHTEDQSEAMTLVAHSPRLIRSTATLLNQRLQEIGYVQLNSTGMRAVLEGLSIRLDETRETLRYVVGLLVFLGLLGTFWGLMQTIYSVGGVIDNLSADGDLAGSALGGSFELLKEGLRQPLNGMGTAFSSSLFGLAGSLLLGFFALRVSQAQNRFYQEYEEWLSGLTRLSGAMVGEGDTSGMGLALSLLEQTADSIDRLQKIISRSESHQAELYTHIGNLNQRLGTLVDSQKIEHELMRKLAEGQLSTRQLLERMLEQDGITEGNEGTSTSIKALEQVLIRLSAEQRQEQERNTQLIRDELRLVARTISNSLGTVVNARPIPSKASTETEIQEGERMPPPLTIPDRQDNS